MERRGEGQGGAREAVAREPRGGEGLAAEEVLGEGGQGGGVACELMPSYCGRVSLKAV